MKFKMDNSNLKWKNTVKKKSFYNTSDSREIVIELLLMKIQ